MGYTHYWYRPTKLDAGKFKATVEDLHKLLPKLPKLYGAKGIGEPVIDAKEIVFNGNAARGEDCETFRVAATFDCPIDIRPNNELKFEFCGTWKMPYDLAVCATLLLLKHHFGDEIQVSSDGDLEDWRGAIELVKREFGHGDYMFEKQLVEFSS